MNAIEQSALVRRIEILEAKDRAADAARVAQGKAITSATTAATAPSMNLVWLEPALIATGDVIVTPAWATYDATVAGVPAGANAVLVDFFWEMDGPDGADTDPTLTAHVYGRTDADGFVYNIAKGRAAGTNDQIGGFSQAFVPLSVNGTFDYEVSDPGFVNGWTMNIVGYLS